MAVSSELRQTIDAGDFDAARRLAVRVPEVGLLDALRLTLLAKSSEPELFEPMARRWLARFVTEMNPAPPELQRTSTLLARVGDGSLPATEAAAPLEQVAACLGS